MVDLVEAGAHHLRLAAQAIRVLHAVARQVRGAQRAAGEPRAVAGGHRALAALAAHRVDAVVERRVAALGRVDRHRADRHRHVEHAAHALHGVDRQCGRRLRAVQQREAFFRAELQRLQPGGCERLRGGQALAVDDRFADADQHAREVCERRQVTRGPDRAFLGDHRQHVGVEQPEQQVDDFHAHAREAVREARRLQQQHQPHDGCRERLSDPGAVRKHEVGLQLREVGVGDARLRELAEAGVDAVHGRVLRDQFAHRVHAGLDAGLRRAGERPARTAGGGLLELRRIELAGDDDDVRHGVHAGGSKVV